MPKNKSKKNNTKRVGIQQPIVLKELNDDDGDAGKQQDSILVYNHQQQQKVIFLGCDDVIHYNSLYDSTKQIMVTTFSLNLLFQFVYYFVIKMEGEYLIEDIKRIKKRFASNAYTRIVNEFNLFMVNSIEINSAEESQPCFLFGTVKYFNLPESQSMLTELIHSASLSSSDDNSHINLDFFLEIYIHYIKQYIGLGPSLDTLKKFVVPYVDLDYDSQERNNLRGAHSDLTELRGKYNDKMKNYYTFNTTSYTKNDDYQDAIEKFATKVKMLVVNPDLMICNHITSQNSVNLKNFKENFLNVNQMAMKDLYNNILDTSDGLVSMRIQNSISKSIYVIVFLMVGIICHRMFKFVKNNYCSRKKTS